MDLVRDVAKTGLGSGPRYDGLQDVRPVQQSMVDEVSVSTSSASCERSYLIGLFCVHHLSILGCHVHLSLRMTRICLQAEFVQNIRNLSVA